MVIWDTPSFRRQTYYYIREIWCRWEKTKCRIRETAEKLAYQPNPFARSLRSRRSRTIAVMVFDITDPYCTQVLRGVEDTLDRRTMVRSWSISATTARAQPGICVVQNGPRDVRIRPQGGVGG